MSDNLTNEQLREFRTEGTIPVRVAPARWNQILDELLASRARVAELEAALERIEREADEHSELCSLGIARSALACMLIAAVASVNGESITIQRGVLEKLPSIVLHRKDCINGSIRLSAAIQGAQS